VRVRGHAKRASRVCDSVPIVELDLKNINKKKHKVTVLKPGLYKTKYLKNK